MSPLTAQQNTTTAKSNPLEFPTELRPQIELNVSSLDQSVKFYKTLFNKPAADSGKNYARFNPYKPAVDFIIKENNDSEKRDGHFGIQLKASKDIQRYRERFEDAGFEVILEEAESACCYSVANKAWINDPDGNQWEIFVVTGENTSDIRCGDTCACEAEGCG